jgi:hypothetical protein
VEHLIPSLADLPLDEVQAVARHMGLRRDAEGYFLDDSTDPPLRLTAEEVNGWHTYMDEKTEEAFDEKLRQMGLLTHVPPDTPPAPQGGLPVAHEAPGGAQPPADLLAKKKAQGHT